MNLFGFAIAIFIIVLISGALKKIPPQYREMEPGMVWLLLIPCVSVVWTFFVAIQVPKSFQNYFESQGRTEFGDCGAKIGLWYAISVIASLLPYVGLVSAMASPVLLIILLVKIMSLKRALLESTPHSYPA